jgi:hypothetical protein
MNNVIYEKIKTEKVIIIVQKTVKKEVHVKTIDIILEKNVITVQKI